MENCRPEGVSFLFPTFVIKREMVMIVIVIVILVERDITIYHIYLTI